MIDSQAYRGTLLLVIVSAAFALLVLVSMFVSNC